MKQKELKPQLQQTSDKPVVKTENEKIQERIEKFNK